MIITQYHTDDQIFAFARDELATLVPDGTVDIVNTLPIKKYIHGTNPRVGRVLVPCVYIMAYRHNDITHKCCVCEAIISGPIVFRRFGYPACSADHADASVAEVKRGTARTITEKGVTVTVSENECEFRLAGKLCRHSPTCFP